MSIIYRSILILFLTTLLSPDSAQGQRILKKVNGKSERIGIIKMDSVSLHYYKYDDPLQIEYIIPVDDILYLYMDDISNNTKIDPQLLNRQRKKLIKVDLPSFTRNSLVVGYEQSIRPRFSAEIMYMVLGLEAEFGQRFFGHGIQLGFKYRITDPATLDRNKKIKHLLEGLYAKPVVGFIFQRQDNNVERVSENIYHGGLQVGYMLVRNRMSIEVFGGYHITGGSGTKTSFNSGVEIPSPLVFNYGEYDGRNNRMVSYGVRLGVLF